VAEIFKIFVLLD